MEDFDILYEHIKSSAYTCNHSGKIIFPEVSFYDGKYNICTTKISAKGGIGNKSLDFQMCQKCADELGCLLPLLTDMVVGNMCE